MMGKFPNSQDGPNRLSGFIFRSSGMMIYLDQFEDTGSDWQLWKSDPDNQDTPVFDTRIWPYVPMTQYGKGANWSIPQSLRILLPAVQNAQRLGLHPNSSQGNDIIFMRLNPEGYYEYSARYIGRYGEMQ
jgi:hypothetical protein